MLEAGQLDLTRIQDSFLKNGRVGFPNGSGHLTYLILHNINLVDNPTLPFRIEISCITFYVSFYILPIVTYNVSNIYIKGVNCDWRGIKWDRRFVLFSFSILFPFFLSHLSSNLHESLIVLIASSPSR